MKHTFCTLLLGLLFNLVQAQVAAIKLGPELYRGRKTDISAIIGSDGDAFYCIRTQRSFLHERPLTIEKYSNSRLALDYIKPLNIPRVNDKELSFEKAVLLNNQVLIFASRYDRNLDKNLLYLMRMSAEQGSKLSAPVEIDHINAEKKNNRGSFDFVLSDDSTKILIMHNEPFERYENQKFSYRLVDSEGNSLWSHHFELPYRDKYFTLSNYKVDNDGNVYMMASITKDRDERERKKPDYTYDLIKYTHKSRSLKEIRIDLGGKYISDINFSLYPADHIAVGGFYSNKNRDGLAGTFYGTISKTSLEVTKMNAQDFSTGFLSEFMSSRRAEKHKEIYNYKIDYFVNKRDGGLYMVAEQYFINVVTVCQPRGGCSTTYYYNYNDIIVVDYNSEASVNWVKHIPKMHVSANDLGYYSSYAFQATNNKLYFIYNDDLKNYTKPKKYPRNGIGRRMITVVASIDKDGNLERKTLFSAKEEKIFTRPKISERLPSGQALFYAIKRKKYKFGIITFL